MADPRFSLVTITSVVTSADLRHAKIYWMISGGKERIPQAKDAFEHAEGLFRRLLARELGTRFVPELRFYYDDTIDTVQTVEELLNRISAAKEESSDDADTELDAVADRAAEPKTPEVASEENEGGAIPSLKSNPHK